MTEDDTHRAPTAEPPLRQAERYGGPMSEDGARRRAPAASLRPVFISGGAMLAATVFAGAAGAAPMGAFVIGVACFFLTLLLLRDRPKVRAAPSRAVNVAKARAAGLDPAAVARRLNEAERHLNTIEKAARALDDAPLESRVFAATTACRATLETVAADPGDIDRARKFLVVTVPSAAAAMAKYAALEVRGAELSGRFGALMDEVADAAARQRAALSRDDALDLEVEMEVLAERLKQT